jgi:hypothetical protein
MNTYRSPFQFPAGSISRHFFHIRFRDFSFDRLRSRTPGPSPFSSMNTTPAASKARRTAKSFGAVIDFVVG